MMAIKGEMKKKMFISKKKGQWRRTLTNQAQTWSVARMPGRSSSDCMQDIWKFLLQPA